MIWFLLDLAFFLLLGNVIAAERRKVQKLTEVLSQLIQIQIDAQQPNCPKPDPKQRLSLLVGGKPNTGAGGR